MVVARPLKKINKYINKNRGQKTSSVHKKKKLTCFFPRYDPNSKSLIGGIAVYTAFASSPTCIIICRRWCVLWARTEEPLSGAGACPSAMIEKKSAGSREAGEEPVCQLAGLGKGARIRPGTGGRLCRAPPRIDVRSGDETEWRTGRLFCSRCRFVGDLKIKCVQNPCTGRVFRIRAALRVFHPAPPPPPLFMDFSKPRRLRKPAYNNRYSHWPFKRKRYS